VGYSGVTQGGIFAYNAHKKVMEMRASYAFSRQKYIIKEVEIGEGLVGRVWREKDIVHITDIPYDYAEISSGLGGAQPKSILVVPLITDGTVVGVMEFAHLQTFAHRQIEFMQRVADSIAATIVRIQIDEETKRLLDESQALAVRLQEQEEETRQSLEEVTTAQELMARNSYEMERQLQALDSVFMMMDFDMRGNFIRVNENLLNLSGYHLSELMNQHFSILLGVRANDTKVLVDWQSILQGNILSGEFVRYNKSGQKFWMYEVIYPLFNKDGKILKISSIGYEITKQKEQERQIHEQLKELQMSKRDVVNRIREVEAKASSRLQRLQTELQEQLKERDRIIQELKNG
jgi:PAS domain S-box-containing protein